jgi:hypothetical protein
MKFIVFFASLLATSLAQTFYLTSPVGSTLWEADKSATITWQKAEEPVINQHKFI